MFLKHKKKNLFTLYLNNNILNMFFCFNYLNLNYYFIWDKVIITSNIYINL